MKLRTAFARGRRGRAHRRPECRFAPRLSALEVRTLLSTITVTNDDDSGSGSLRDAIGTANPGDTIDFARSAYGTITLTSGPLVVPNIDLTIQGPGANKLTISGDDASTVFELGALPYNSSTPAASMTLSGMTIADGNANNGFGGGGILAPVNLTLTNSVLKDNQAPNNSGGGISNAGNRPGLSLTIDNDLFEDNTAGSASVNVFSGHGGAIDAENGSIVSVTSSTFTDNQSVAPEAQGGAINLSNSPFGFAGYYGSVSVTGSTFRGNVASSSSTYGGGSAVSFSAAGGAIWADPQVGVTIGSSQFLDNEAEVAALSFSQGTAAGGGIEVNPGTVYGFPPPPPSAVTITNTLFSGNTAVGTGTAGSLAEGGALNAAGLGYSGGGTITISGTTFTANLAMGDSTSINPSDVTPGPAQGGAVNTYLDALALTGDTFSGNEAVSGSGQGVQYALGGAISSQLYQYSNPYPTLTTTISQSLFTGNQAIGGTGAPSFGPNVEGGALALTDTPASVTTTTFLGNQALGSPGTTVSSFPPYFGNLGIGGAVYSTGAALSIQGGLIAGNEAMGGQGGGRSGGTGETGGYAWGGGIFVGGQGALTLSGTAIEGNGALGGAGGQGRTGGSGGYGQGAGVYVYYGGSAKIANATILGNTAVGGAGGQGTTTPGVAGNAQGGGVFEYASTLKISDSIIAGNSAVGGPGGGEGEGGGVFVSGTGANAALTDVLITLNSAIGGSGGGSGYGGGLYVATGAITTLTKTKVVGNFATTSGNNIYGSVTTG